MKLIIFLLIAYIIIFLLACNSKETFKRRGEKKWKKNSFKKERRKSLDTFMNENMNKDLQHIKNEIRKRQQHRKNIVRKIVSGIESLRNRKRSEKNVIKKDKYQSKIYTWGQRLKFISNVFKKEVKKERDFFIKRKLIIKHQEEMNKKLIVTAKEKAEEDRKEDKNNQQEIEDTASNASHETTSLTSISTDQKSKDYEMKNQIEALEKQRDELITLNLSPLEKAKRDYKIEKEIINLSKLI